MNVLQNTNLAPANDSTAIAAIAPSDGDETAKISTRVLLRVKRRRPLKTEHAFGGPERIRLALADPPNDGEDTRCGAKRRRLSQQREDLALVARLDSAVSISKGNEANDNGNSLNSNRSLRDTNGDMLPDPEIAVLHTPPRTCHGNRPTSSPSTASVAGSAPERKETPAPPTKPRRSVVFRKMADLQKRLDAFPPPSSRPAPKEDAACFERPAKGARGGGQPLTAMTPAGDGDEGVSVSAPVAVSTSWSQKGEAGSTLLRVVDVALREEEDPDGADVGHDRAPVNDAASAGSIITGSGRRLRRMRLSPTLDVDKEKDNERGGEQVEARRKKRRKLGWVVERSRTMLQSEFWHEPTAAAAASHGPSFEEVLQLIESSLLALAAQGGGSVAPHLSFLQRDPRLGFAGDTARDRMMVNHALGGTRSTPCSEAEGRGRTVLHIAALWGDLVGVTRALEMGADPAIADAGGCTAAELARGRRQQQGCDYSSTCYHKIMEALLEGGRRAAERLRVQGSTLDDGIANQQAGGGKGRQQSWEYYYEYYECLEGTEEKKVDPSLSAVNPRSLPLRHPGSVADSIPDLECSAALSEDDSDNGDDYAAATNRALLTLQRGCGYWNEQDELVLEARAGGPSVTDGAEQDQRFVQQFYRDVDDDMSVMDDDEDDEHDSNAEAYDGNDYPDDDASFCGSGSSFSRDGNGDYRDADAYGHLVDGSDDDDGENEWVLTFRDRFVPRRELQADNIGTFADAYRSRDRGGEVAPSDLHAMAAEARDEGGGNDTAFLA